MAAYRHITFWYLEHIGTPCLVLVQWNSFERRQIRCSNFPHLPACSLSRYHINCQCCRSHRLHFLSGQDPRCNSRQQIILWHSYNSPVQIMLHPHSSPQTHSLSTHHRLHQEYCLFTHSMPTWLCQCDDYGGCKR